MPFTYRVTSAIFVLSAMLGLAGPADAAAPVYSIQAIKGADGLSPKEAFGISGSGRLIVGGGTQTGDPATETPFRTKRAKAGALDQPCARFSDKECNAFAASVNASGEAVGTMSVGPVFQNRYYAQYWGKDGKVVDLDAKLPCRKSIKHSYGVSINDAGAMVLIQDCADEGGEWVKTSYVYADGQLTPIPSLGPNETDALAINNRGQVVGYALIPNGADHHGFIWENGVTRDLGDIDGSARNIATDINDLGHAIVGTTGTGFIGKNYIIDVATGAKTLIAHCHGGDGPSPGAINNRDEVTLSDSRSESWLYTGGQCHAFVDLLDASQSGWKYLVITDIDDEGVIVGHGYHNKAYKAFIAKPVVR